MIRYKKEDAVRVWPDGRYQATVASVEEKQSKSSGNDMLEVAFTVYANSGNDSIRVSDYIVFPRFVWRLKRLAAALGAQAAFEAETFDPADYIGHNLSIDLSIQEARDGYEERNQVTAYHPSDAGKGEARPGADIPF